MNKCIITNCEKKVVGKIEIMNKTYFYCENKVHIHVVLLKFRVENHYLFNKTQKDLNKNVF